MLGNFQPTDAGACHSTVVVGQIFSLEYNLGTRCQPSHPLLHSPLVMPLTGNLGSCSPHIHHGG